MLTATVQVCSSRRQPGRETNGGVNRVVAPAGAAVDAALPAIVTVGICGTSEPSAAALQAALDVIAADIDRLGWHVVSRKGEGGADVVRIVVCTDDSSVGDAGTQWPGAVRVALVPSHDDGHAVVAALQRGADVCVRGTDPGLVAAYVQAVARRHGFVRGGASR